MKLEIEEAALKHEKDNLSKERLSNLQKELAEMRDEYSAMKARWENEKNIVDEVKKLKAEIESVNARIENAQLRYEYETAARLKYSHPAETAERYAGILKRKGCDLIICLTHLGYEGELYTDQELAAAIRNVDIIVGGHSHTRIDRPGVVKDLDGDDVLIVTDGKWGIEIGKLTVR